MFDLLADLGRRAAAAIAASTGPHDKLGDELPVVPAGKPEFGDFQISACLQLGKPLGRPPRELAKLVAEALAGHPALAKVEIAGPGFVNLHLADAFLAERTAALADDAALGLRPVGAGRRVVIDYSSPNVAKPMHIGHIRSTIIGAALDRTLRALGWDVIADNHLGDWGTQFGKLIVAWRKWRDESAYEKDPVAELERIYVKFVEEDARERGEQARKEEDAEAANEPSSSLADSTAESGRELPLIDQARRELAKLQSGDPANRALWQKFVDGSRHSFEAIYRRLDIRFDYYLGESAYNQMLPTVVQELQRRRLARESQGALVVFFDENSEVLAADRQPIEEAKLPPFIVRKADGGFNYATTDIAGMAYRTGLFQAARIIILTDERQQLHFKQLFSVARRLGVGAELEHVWFGLMRFWNEATKEWEAGSTRKGNVVHLEELLDEAERRAHDVAREHNPSLTEQELIDVARVVGVGAVKYNDLSRDRQSLVSFTWDKALALQGNTAPYLQYAYARIRSILRKAEQAPARARVILGAPVERELARRLLAYPDAVEQVARTLRPHVLADYLYELSGAFSRFYDECPVLKAEPDVRASRLLLTELVARALKAGLGLLGIEVLERM
jgi:arginyl-tRNA synthetase